MLDIRNPLLWLMGILALSIFLLLGRTRFNTEARERRRREKSHRRVISRKQGPTVKLAVNAGKPERDKKS